ncbi:cytochrome P450 2J6-like [Asterias rubens]|uniref:cytochrome P450 2J6-like n=1 Tax=Asterias rubens TaxID=7604 RepID=UPI001455D281|nr:cytochrome P450 2J6-like [Asterias rubens]
MAFLLGICSSLTVKSVLVGLIALFIATWFYRRPRNLPPGPTGWPLLGYLPNLISAGDEYKNLTRLAKTYGPVFSMNLGGTLVVVVNSFASIKEALSHPNTADRAPTRFFKKMTDDPDALSVGTASGDSWSQQRKFCLSVLRGLGVWRSSFEDAIATEAGCLINGIKEHEGNPFNPAHLLGNAVSNVICSVTLGKRFDYADPKFQQLLKSITRIFEMCEGGDVYTYLPIMEYLSFTSTFKDIESSTRSIIEFLRESVENHQSNLDVDNPKDFIDVFLREIHDNETKNIKSYITKNNMLLTCFDLFTAGTETSSTTLRWALLYMVAYPKVQAKIQQEIDDSVGRNRLPRLADKPQLPYTEATILEVQRLASIAALGVTHMFSKDTNLLGFDIPEGTRLLTNLWAVSRDPSIWSSPEEFKPERFIDEAGSLKPREEHLPFASGRRVCLGEQLAKMELFIFFSHLLHQFSFKKPDESQPLSFEAVNGLTLTPIPFEVCAIPRE